MAAASAKEERAVRRGFWLGEAFEFPILRVSNLVAWQSTDSACRPVKGVESARGTF